MLRAPTCLQTFFSPSDFKIKNFKKEFKKKKKRKKRDFRGKETYFQNADTLLQSSGIEQCRRFPPAIVVDCRLSPFVEVTRRCGHCLAHADALSGKPGFPRGSSTPFHVFCNPTPSTEDVIKKQTKKNKEKKRKKEKNTKKKNT